VATIHYHKFRLTHKDTDYQFTEAAAAALLTANKIEDTLKKSRDIICAAHNLKVPSAEQLSPDDVVSIPPFGCELLLIAWQTFDALSKVIIGLERLVLESSGFDFRSFHPHDTLTKLLKSVGISKAVSDIAFEMMIDLHKTFAPLKQVTTTMAVACAELAALVADSPQDQEITKNFSADYDKWSTSRAEVVETALDLLDLYTQFQKQSDVGPRYNIGSFIKIQIKYNQEVEQTPGLSRYTEYHDYLKSNGYKTNIKTPKTPITPASPTDVRTNGASPATLSPRSSGSRKMGVHGEGTVRFMLDAEQAKRERETVDEYHKVEYEEYEVEVEEPVQPERAPQGHHRPSGPAGRDDRYHPSKRGRRV
jgi:CTD kinase subunit beta